MLDVQSLSRPASVVAALNSERGFVVQNSRILWIISAYWLKCLFFRHLSEQVSDANLPVKPARVPKSQLIARLETFRRLLGGSSEKSRKNLII